MAHPVRSLRAQTPYLLIAVLLVAFFTLPLLPEEHIHSVPASPPAGKSLSPDIERRIGELENQLAAVPHDSTLWEELGNLYFDSGNPVKAIHSYTRALEITPGNPDILTDLGIMYREIEQFNLAAESFTQALSIEPAHQNALFNLGVVLYFDLHRHESGKEAWERLLGINPQATTPDGRSVRELLSTLQ